MSTFEATLNNLPKPILDKLRAIIGRVRRLLFIRGLSATLAVALVCVLAIMAIDASFTLFSSTARWALTLSGLAVTLATAWWFLVRPLSKRITLTHIARILEIRHPELQERISTAVELMSSSDPESVKGSEELIAAVVDSAVIDVDRVDPKTEFKGGRASRFAMMAGVAFAVLALLFAIWPRQAGVLMARAVAPFLDIGNAWSDTLEVKPGDIRVAIGETVTIEMTVDHSKLRRAEIRRKLADGSESVERMSQAGEDADGRKRFAITFPSVDDSFDYRVRAGSAVSEFFTVEAVPKPVVERLTLRYDFPAYTKREPAEFESDTGEIRALANTEVTVKASLNKPISEAEFQIPGVPLETEPEIAGNEVSWKFPLVPGIEGRWRLKLIDEDGFKSEPTDHSITALPDLAPQVKITAPTFKELRLRPSELLPIRYAIAEDIGLSDVTLLVMPGGETKPREIAQPSPEVADGQPGVWHGLASLNLATLDLEPTQKRLVVQLRARDNLPAEFEGPNEGYSEKLIIIIDEKAKSLAEQTLAAQKEEMREAIKEARQDLQEAKSEVQQAERQLAREDKVSTDTMRDLDEFREKANQAQETLREMAKRSEQTAFRPQGEKLREVADEQVAEARESADMIPVSDEKDKRVAEAKEAQQQIDQATKQLDEIEKSLGEADKDLKMVAELNELANDQRQLAQEAARQAQEEAERRQQNAQQQNAQQRAQQEQQLTAEQMRKLAEFRKQQEKVQKELGEMLKESPEALRDILARQQQQAAQLAEQAESVAQEQQQLQEMTDSAANPEANQQEALKEQMMASLQQMQRQIAQETQSLKEKLDREQPEAGKPLEGASEQTQQAANSLEQEKMDSAKDAARQATEALAQASQQAEALAEQAEKTQAEAESAKAQEAGQSTQENQSTDSPQMAQANQPESAQAEASNAANEEANSSQKLSDQSKQPNAAENAEKSPKMAEAQSDAASQNPENPAETSPPATPQGENDASQSMAQKGEAGEPEEATSSAQEPQTSEASNGNEGEQKMAQQGEQASPTTEEGSGSEATQPSKPSPLAADPARQQLAQLAKQQEMISQQLQAMETGQFDDALAMMEQQLAQETQSIQQQAEALEQATEAANQNDARSRADQAENALQGAADQAQQASQQLAQAQQAQNQAQQQGQPANQPAPKAQQSLKQSQGKQNQAQQGMSNAAQSLQQAADMLAQSLQNMQATPEDQSDVLNPQNLSEAFDDTGQSAQSQDSQQAAQNSQQAAESLQQLAQAAMEQMGAMGQPSQQQGQPTPQMQPEFVDGANPQLNETGMKTADINGDGLPPELKELGISAADWARLKGNLRSGGAAQGGDDLPAEYRELVGRYFQVIAREAGKSE
ncbi:MAG: hypothetical protein KDN19_10955 [Verrucomicrobiae bacterium]|nr:hypothetical protein [Verrucomicrobiae bacterium]